MEIMSYPPDIQIFIDKVIHQIKSVLNPEYIILCGSFGKGSWLYFENELISDFEFVFVCNKKWSLKSKKSLLRSLNNQFQYDISLKGYVKSNVENKVLSNYSRKKSSYISLDFFDSFEQPKILYNKRNESLNIKLASSEIPIWEAWRLYVNRMGDLLKLEFPQKQNPYTEDYYWLKIFESTADAFCIVNKIYYKNINKRIKVFKNGIIEHNYELNDTCKNSCNLIINALESRKNHNLSIFKIDIDNKQRKKIINSWMNYIEKKLSIQENLIGDGDNFYLNYIKNKDLQKKYLEINNRFSLKFSNLIRLIYHPGLVNLNFKFYNQNDSWRHIILLSVSSTFKEQSLDFNKFNMSKFILSKILKLRNLKEQTNQEFIYSVLKHWKMLR